MVNKRNFSSSFKPILSNKHVKSYSYIAFSILAITILGLFAVRPTIKTIITLQQTVNQRSALLKKLEAKSTSIQSGIDFYNNQIDDNSKIKLLTLVPSTTSLPCLVDNLNNLASTYQTSVIGLQVEQVDIKGVSKCLLTSDDLKTYQKEANPDKVVQDIKFTFNVSGSYSQMVGMLSAFTNYNRLISLETVNFNKADDGTLTMSISGAAFYYK